MTVPSFDFEQGEILNIDKPVDWTSFDVVKKIRSHIKPAKVGHAGTLDPFATGVLLICTGKATRRVQELMELQKEYVATMEFGKATDTYDVTGKVLLEKDASGVTLEDVKRVCARFEGQVEQVPPMYSAVKVKGERLYKLARRGEEVSRKARKVYIYKLELLDFSNPFLQLKIVCSKGTYIRALAHEMGEEIGTGAYLTELTRTRIGPYRIEDAYSISDFIKQLQTPAVH